MNSAKYVKNGWLHTGNFDLIRRISCLGLANSAKPLAMVLREIRLDVSNTTFI